MRAAQWRFAAIAAAMLLLHAAALIALLYRFDDVPEALPQEEIPVEIVQEMPKAMEKLPPPPPEQKPPPAQPKPEEQPQIEKSLKPAFDAPRDPNQEKVEREAPEKITQALEQAKAQPEPPAEKPAAPDTQKIAPAPAQERKEQAQQPGLDDEKPDAEVLPKAELQQKNDKLKSNSEAAKTRKPLSPDMKAALTKQLASLSSPSPNFTLGSMSKPSPVSGGTENTNYLSVLYGLIMKRLQNPNAARPMGGETIIYFALDDNGNLIHQVVAKGSGFPDIDQATLDAVRRAAPFPPPPRDTPHRFYFSRDIESGR